MASIRRRKNRGHQRWLLDYVDIDDRRYQIDTRTTDEDIARVWLAKAEDLLARAAIGQIETVGRITPADIRGESRENVERRKNAPKAKRIRLSEFAVLYDERGRTELGLSDNTRTIDRNAVNLYKRIIGDLYLNEITVDQIIRVKKWMQDNNYSPVTEAMYQKHLKAAFNRAVKWGYLEESPFNDVAAVPRTRRRRAMTEEEILQLLRTAEAKNLPYSRFLKTLIYLGVRRNEARMIRGEDVDLDNKVVKVTITKKRGEPVDVRLPINKALYRIFSQMNIREGEYLFPSPQVEGQPLSASFVTHYFKTLLEAAGLPRERYTLHSLRHSYTSHLKAKKVPIDIIQRLQSHSSPRITWGTYDHTEALHYRDISDMVDFEQAEGEDREDRT